MIYLIDFENVHEDGFSALGRLGDKDSVYCFFTRNVAKISMSALAGMRSGQLHFVEADTGKQSLDLALVSYLGYLIGTRPQELCYEIVSNDNGFQKAADFWNKRGMNLRVRVRKTNVPDPKVKADAPKDAPAALPAPTVKTDTPKEVQPAVPKKQSSSVRNRTRKRNPELRKTAEPVKEAGAGKAAEETKPLNEELPKELPAAAELKPEPIEKTMLKVEEKAKTVMPVKTEEQTEPEKTEKPVKTEKVEKTTAQTEEKQENPALIAALEAAGITGEKAEFLQAQLEMFREEKNVKQLVYRALVKKYGQKNGTEIYNTAKKIQI